MWASEVTCLIYRSIQLWSNGILNSAMSPFASKLSGVFRRAYAKKTTKSVIDTESSRLPFPLRLRLILRVFLRRTAVLKNEQMEVISGEGAHISEPQQSSRATLRHSGCPRHSRYPRRSFRRRNSLPACAFPSQRWRSSTAQPTL